MNEPGSVSQTHHALAGFQQGLKALLPETHLVAPTEIGRFSTGLEERILQGPVPPPRILEQLRGSIVEALESGAASLPLSMVDWLDVPRVLFAPWRGCPLIAAMPVRRGLFQAVYRGPRNTYLVRLIDAYLRNFDLRYAEELRFLGGTILELLSITRRASATAATWWQRHQEFALFAPEAAPSRLAERVIHRADDALASIFESAGLVGSLDGGGLSHAALVKYAASAPCEDASTMTTITHWRTLCPGETAEMKAAVLQVLVKRWVREEPPSAVRDWLLHWLEPSRSAGTQDLVLTALEPEVRLRLEGWLEEDLGRTPLPAEPVPAPGPKLAHGVTDFFDLLEQYARQNGEEGRIGIWQQQRRLWEAYASAGLIRETRLALGFDVVRRFGRKTLQMQLGGKFGRLKGFGGSHCIMLLRFQRLIVLFDSHHPRCRFWRINDPRAPVLTVHVFHRSEFLRTPPTDLHVVPGDRRTGVSCSAEEPAVWQRLICNFVREQSGEDLSTAALFASASSPDFETSGTPPGEITS